jgi:hypothetical protein
MFIMFKHKNIVPSMTDMNKFLKIPNFIFDNSIELHTKAFIAQVQQ